MLFTLLQNQTHGAMKTLKFSNQISFSNLLIFLFYYFKSTTYTAVRVLSMFCPPRTLTYHHCHIQTYTCIISMHYCFVLFSTPHGHSTRSYDLVSEDEDNKIYKSLKYIYNEKEEKWRSLNMKGSCSYLNFILPSPRQEKQCAQLQQLKVTTFGRSYSFLSHLTKR